MIKLTSNLEGSGSIPNSLRPSDNKALGSPNLSAISLTGFPAISLYFKSSIVIAFGTQK